jgi:hypothetical protein
MTAFDGSEFGVVLPRGSAAADVKIPSRTQARVHVTVRFLQIQARSIEAYVRDDFLPVARLTIDDADYLSSEESVGRECEFAFDAVPGRRMQFPIAISGGLETDTLFDGLHAVRGRVVRERWPLHGSVSIETTQIGDSLNVHTVIANESDVTDGADRAIEMRTSFLSLSLQTAVEGAGRAAGAL